MAGDKRKCFLYGNSRTRPYYFRRCKRMAPTNIESLPDELLFDILVRLPAAYLHHRARFVCRRWSHIIHSHDFVNAQNHRSMYGLHLGDRGREPLYYNSVVANTHPILVTATQEGRIERHDIHYTCRTRLFGSSNGLALDMEENGQSLYISNPAINYELLLPWCSRPNCIVSRCGIGYVAASMTYKVILPYEVLSSEGYPIEYLAILTVGVDKTWRDIVDLPRIVSSLVFHYPSTTEGFIHWCRDDFPYVLTLDVETEIVTVNKFPCFDDVKIQSTFLSTGRFLSFLVRNGDLSWEVWAMKSGNGEWSKLLPDIELGGLKCRLQQFAYYEKDELRPLGWVKYPEVLAFYYFSASRSCITYNLATHEINSIQLPEPVYYYTASVHKNTLIRLT